MSSTATISQPRYFTVATAGHVDHGKTSLLRALTGIDPDRLKEEKERQMTTDIGFAHLQLASDLVIGFIDVPGHGKFLKNMLAGVGGIDMALLVVAADEGPMPQTEQHAKILSLLGVRQVLVAITKMDMVDSLRADAAIDAVKELFQRLRLDLLGCVKVSNVKQTGMDALREMLKSCVNDLPSRQMEGAAFFPVDRVFTKAGFGTVVTGTLVRGQLTVGDQVYIEPIKGRARIRRLETFGHTVEVAQAGQRLACNLALKEDRNLVRGQVVSNQLMVSTTSLLVSLSGWEDRTGDLHDLNGQDVRLYHGTAECHGRIGWVEEGACADSAPANKRSVLGLAMQQSCSLRGACADSVAGPNLQATAIAHIVLSDPIAMEPGDRFVIRLSDETICGGVMLMRDRPRWLTRAKAKDLAQILLTEDYQGAVLAYLQNSPQSLLNVENLQRFIPGRNVLKEIENLIAEGAIIRLGDHLLTPESKAATDQSVLEEISKRNAQNDLSSDMQVPLEHLRTSLKPAMDRLAFQALIKDMIDKKLLVKHGDMLALPGVLKSSGSDPQMELLHGKIIQVLSEHVCLELSELGRLCNASSPQLKRALEQLEKQEQAGVVNYDFAALSTVIERAHKVLSKLWQEKQNIAPGDFKEGLGTSRKYAMALLGYFDDHQITRRTNTGRALLRQPRN